MITNAPPNQTKSRGTWQGYLLLGLLCNAAIWSAAFYYLKVTRPTYTSQWSLILPGSSPGVSINLPNIGQADSSSTSPFGGSSLDPRANYKYIATSKVVLAKASAAMKMTVKAFGEPRVKLLDNTSIIEFQLKGTSPKEAQQKSQILYQALLAQIRLLRVEEVARRDEGAQATLQTARTKLQEAQQRISQYKAASGLSFAGQVDNLSTNLEQLRRQRSEMLAQQRQTVARLQQLSRSLQLSPQQAANAFSLQADQQFQQNLKDYSESSATLAVFLSKWGPNHPDVLKERAKQQAAQEALIERGSSLLGRPMTQPDLEYLQLNVQDSGNGRASLFHDLIAVQADAQGLTSGVQTLGQQIAHLESRLTTLAQRQSVLENLQRDEKTAEAVFASTLAKLDLGKSDIFTAYPLVQKVEEPSLAEEPSSPHKTLVLAGALLGSGFVSAGFILLWWRSHRRSAKSVAVAQLPLPLDPKLGGERTI
jgi:uncharacterized protein involved in exopolysaccharide biosynthesis